MMQTLRRQSLPLLEFLVLATLLTTVSLCNLHNNLCGKIHKAWNADLNVPPSLVAEVANLHPVVLDQYHFHPGHTPASQSVETQQPHKHRHVTWQRFGLKIVKDTDNSITTKLFTAFCWAFGFANWATTPTIARLQISIGRPGKTS